jgi:hypothetical protein
MSHTVLVVDDDNYVARSEPSSIPPTHAPAITLRQVSSNAVGELSHYLTKN